VTESYWLQATEPHGPLRWLQKQGISRSASGRRKLRLFACACCRRIAEWQAQEAGRRAVEVAERFADGEASKEELAAVRPKSTILVRNATVAAREVAWDAAWFAFVDAGHTAARAGNVPLKWGGSAPEYAAQVRLLHDLFGNPFRPVAADPAWLKWNDGAVRDLTRAIYAERASDRLPMLADALEDAGCTDADLLGHCRGPGPHVRGCWALDLLLGKG
jgi:hypothetical protein